MRAAVVAGPRLIPAVASFTLINADTDQPVAGYTTLAAGATLDLSKLPTTRLNVRANVNSATKSVKFGYDANANYRVESGAPFALASDVGGNYKPWTPTVGSHTVKATAYAATGATGTAGAGLSVSFKVVSGTVTPIGPVVSVVATDAFAAEPGTDTGAVTVSRTGSTAADLTVNLTLGGTAIEGADFQAIARTVTIPAGSTWTVIPVAAVDDTLQEAGETVVVKLAAGTGYSVAGAQSAATVTLVDDDAPTGQVGAPQVAATVVDTASVAVSWSADAAATGYRLTYAPGEYAAGPAGQPQTFDVPAGQTAATLTGLLSDTMYTVRVQALDAAAQPGPAGRALVTTAAPAGLRRYLYTAHLPKNVTGYYSEKPRIEVYDVDNAHQWVRNIPLPTGIYNVRGIAASVATNRLYLTFFNSPINGYQPGGLLCLDLTTGAVVFRRDYAQAEVGSPDRFDVTPDGSTIYMPVGEHGTQGGWVVIDAGNGNPTGFIPHVTSSHNTIVSLDGRFAFLEGQEKGTQPAGWAHTVAVVDTATNTVVRRVGPFRDVVRPFTVNGDASLMFATMNNFNGFQVADVTTGAILYTAPTPGVAQPDPTKNLVVNHGIALSPDESRLYEVDTGKVGIHVWDVSALRAGGAPTYVGFIKTRYPGKNLAGVADPSATNDVNGGPAWLDMSRDGRWLYAESGEVIDTATLKVTYQLRAKTVGSTGGLTLDPYSHSRFILEVDVLGGTPVQVSKQFAIGKVR